MVKSSCLQYSEDDIFLHIKISTETFPENTDENYRRVARWYSTDAPRPAILCKTLQALRDL